MLKTLLEVQKNLFFNFRKKKKCLQISTDNFTVGLINTIYIQRIKEHIRNREIDEVMNKACISV